MLAPSTLALLSTHFAEGPARTRALSLYAAAAGVGATLGLVLGGLFADLVSWRAGFFINLPIGLVLIAAGRRHIAETATRPGRFAAAIQVCQCRDTNMAPRHVTARMVPQRSMCRPMRLTRAD